jgi:hypothetical protein
VIGVHTNALAAADWYGERGYATIPIAYRGKRPSVENWPKLATTDPAIHAEWFGVGPMNIGIATGQKSGVFAVDVDAKSGGLDTLRQLEETHGALPLTPTQQTGGGGLHFLFKLPPNFVVKNRGEFMPGIDIRGEGGQIVAAPSLHESGVHYAWKPGLAPGEVAVADPPHWLLELLQLNPAKAPTPGVVTKGSGRIVVDPDHKPEFKPKPADAASVVAGCVAIRPCYERPTEVSEWLWKMAVGVIGRTEDGRRLAHYMSSLDSARYSEQDVDKVLDRLLKDSRGAFTCDAFAQEVPSACLKCPFRHKIRSPLQLGREHRALIELQAQHFYSTADEVYYDVRRRITKTSKDFAATYADKLKVNPHQAFICSPTAPKVDQLKYMPGAAGVVVRDSRGVVFGNTYMDDGVVAVDGDSSILQEHFQFLLPNQEGERDHLLNAMAHTLQRPEQKLRHAILIKGGQGTGKSTIATIWARMLGESNCVSVGKDELESTFQGGIYNRQLAVFEELFLKGCDRYNELKDFISDDAKRAQKKNVDFYTARTPFAILALSNKELPILIPEANDRRWFVIESSAQLRDEGYYKRLHGDGMMQLGAFKKWLLDRDISEFSPNAPPPMTEAKRSMIQKSQTPLERMLPEILDELGREVAEVSEIQSLLGHKGVRASSSEVQDALRRLGAAPLGQKRVGRERPSLWAIKNAEKWKAAGSDELIAELRPVPISVPGVGTMTLN